MTEQDYQRKIKEHFKGLGCQVSKYQAGPYGEKGHSDLIIGIPPKYFGLPVAVYVEVKKPGEKLSPFQVSWHHRMEAAGHWVCVASDYLDVYRFLAYKDLRLP